MSIIIIVLLVLYIGYLQAVVAGKKNGLKCATLMYKKMCDEVMIEQSIGTIVRLRIKVENEVAEEMGLEQPYL